MIDIPGFHEQLRHPKDWEAARASKAERIVSLIDHHRGETRSDTALEIGSSTCAMTRVFRDHFRRVIAIDVDLWALRVCEPAFERVLASATALPFKSESFDVLVANHTLEYAPSVPKALAEMARVLGANGLVYLAAVNRLKFLPVPLLPRSLKGAFFDLFHAGESNIGHPLAYWEWRERLREFLSTDGTIDVLEYADPSVSSATTRIARSIPLPILQLMAPLFPSWIFYLHKAPRTG